MGKNLVIQQKNGELRLFSKKPLRTVTKAELSQSIISDDYVDITVETSEPLKLNLEDRIIIDGRDYFLNLMPQVHKINATKFIYEMRFEGVAYLLRKIKIFNLDKAGFKNDFEFSFTGTLQHFLTLIINNANKREPNKWIVGECPNNEDTKTIAFNNQNVLSALQTVCKEFEQEFDIKQIAGQYILNIRKTGKELNYSFEYGKGNGLYTLKRNRLNDTEVVTCLYAYGSGTNLPIGYRDYSPKLRMPKSKGDFILNQAMVDTFGYVEDIYHKQDIKPTFKGKITRHGNFDESTKSLEIVVDNMDFDLNEKDNKGQTKWLIAGTAAKLHFNTGNLAGYSFELLANGGYNHATKTFKIRQFEDERKQKFPEQTNPAFRLNIGDEFVILDINLPDKYVQSAEQKLYEEAKKEYEKVAQNNVKYELDADPEYLRNKQIYLGDYARIIDRDFGLDKKIRIVSLKYDILKGKYSFDVADTFEISLVKEIINSIKTIKTEIGTQKKANRVSFFEGYKRLQELKNSVFDTEGYFDPQRIKPESIETNMLSVGAKNQQFILEGVIFKPNIGENANHIQITAGNLIHMSILEANQPKKWNITSKEEYNLSDRTYYIYAKCSVNGRGGEYIITTEQIKFDRDVSSNGKTGYYHFLLAVLYRPQSGVRFISLMYGTTFINGGQITTGRITSVNGKTWFDLDKGEIRISNDNPLIGQIVDNIEIGGRNLFKGKAHLVGNDYNTSDNSEIGFIKIIGAPNKSNAYSFISLTNIEAGKPYSMSIKLKGKAGVTAKLDFCMDFPNKRKFSDITFSGEWQIFKIENVIKEDINKRSLFGIEIHNGSGVVEYKDLMITQSTKATDWTPAPEDVESSISQNTRLINAQVKRVEDIENKTKFIGETTINGDVIATGTLLVGNQNGANAGISGIGNNDDIFLWGGTPFKSRLIAPFRVTRNGKLFATNATISGEISAEEGNIGYFQIKNGHLITEQETRNYKSLTSVAKNQFSINIIGKNHKTGNINNESYKRVLLGTTTPPSSDPYNIGAAASIHNHAVQADFMGGEWNANRQPNIALRLSAKNARENIALDIENGDIRIGDRKGVMAEIEIFHGFNASRRLKLVITRGLITSIEQ